MHIDGIPHRRPIRPHPWPEPQRPQNLRQPAVVSSVPRLVERDQRSVPLFVDVEPRDEVIRLDSVRCGKRRNEKIPQRRRIILARATSGPWPDAAAPPRSHTRSDPAAGARSRSRSPRRARPCASRRSEQWIRCRGQGGRDGRLWWLLHLGRLHRWNRRRHFRSCRRTGPHSDELQPILARGRRGRAATSAARGAGPSSAYGRLVPEVGDDNGRNDEKKDHRVDENRRGDPFPPLFLPERQPDRRAITSSYFTSLGGTPITLTPAPRATSIAWITSEYLTFSSPLTKMTFSGRGS